MKNAIPLIGRILLAAVFVTSGLNKLGDGFAQTQQYMQANGMGFTAFWLTIGIILELVGAVSVIFGIYPRIGALMLLAFLVPVTFIFHNVLADQSEMIPFMKNMSMNGGLLVLAWSGGGDWVIRRLGGKKQG